jgi:peptide deformylase
MSEFLTIDTSSGVVTEEIIEPLKVFGENHPMLSVAIPEYKEAIPNPSMKNLVARLKMTMKLYNGIGLSANQCGIFQRVFVIGTEHFQIACINPKVVAKSEELSRENEGCLSFPGMFLRVERPTWVDAEFYDETGAFKQIRLEGLTAKCYLHELDHMNGVKFIDHAGPLAVQMARQKQGKLVKQIVRIQKNAKKMGNKK